MKAIQRIMHYVATKLAIFILSIACPLMLGVAPNFKPKEFERGRR